MIVLKILLWILLAVLGLIVFILLIPVRAEAAFLDSKLTYKLKYSFIPLYDSDGKGLLAWYLKRKKAKAEKAGEATDDEAITVSEEETGISDLSAESVPDLTEPEEKPSEAPAETASAEKKEESPAKEDIPEKELEKPKKEKHKKEKNKKKDGGEEVIFPKTLIDKADLVLDIWRAADRPILRIFKGIKLHELYIDFIIANEDAYKCALTYGSISGTLYNVLGWLSVLFNVKLKTIDVNAGFGLSKSRWDAAGKLCVRPMTMVIAGIMLLITYSIKYFIPYKLQERKLKKQAVRQK